MQSKSWMVTTLFNSVAIQASTYLARPMISYKLLELHSSSFTIGAFGALYALFPLILAIPLGRWINQLGEGRFIAAFKNKTVDCGMTTEPTISAILQQNLGYVLTDLRYGDLTKSALGYNYVATSVYGMTDWINAHPALVQGVVNAMYDTMAWIDAHTPLQIAQAMPADYYAGVGLDSYVNALTNEKVMYNPGIRMPVGAALGVLRAEQKGRIQYGSWTAAKVAAVNLNATFTNAFVNNAVSQVKAWHRTAKTKVGSS